MRRKSGGGGAAGPIVRGEEEGRVVKREGGREGGREGEVNCGCGNTLTERMELEENGLRL